jgi:glutaredoxin
MRHYPYIVIDAPGYYDRLGTVYSRHETLRAAVEEAQEHRYKDETGKTQVPVVVADNTNGYKRGDTFWADMPPLQIDPNSRED